MFLGTGKALILHDEGYQQVQGHTESTVQAGAGITVVSGSELNDYLTNTNSGSGSGLPLLVQRSVARQVFMSLLCTGGPLLTLFFETLEKQPYKQKTV